jgi:hypothetical protein
MSKETQIQWLASHYGHKECIPYALLKHLQNKVCNQNILNIFHLHRYFSKDKYFFFNWVVSVAPEEI